MATDDSFATYAEAVAALCSVEEKKRAALRRAVETHAGSQAEAKARRSDQQRMYDHARQDLEDAKKGLAEIRSMLDLPRTGFTARQPRPEPPPALSQIRANFGDVLRWTQEAESTAESLLRTRDRLAKQPAAKSVEPVPAAVPLPPSPTWPTWPPLIAVCVVGAVLIIVLINQ